MTRQIKEAREQGLHLDSAVTHDASADYNAEDEGRDIEILMQKRIGVSFGGTASGGAMIRTPVEPEQQILGVIGADEKHKM